MDKTDKADKTSVAHMADGLEEHDFADKYAALLTKELARVNKIRRRNLETLFMLTEVVYDEGFIPKDPMNGGPILLAAQQLVDEEIELKRCFEAHDKPCNCEKRFDEKIKKPLELVNELRASLGKRGLDRELPSDNHQKD